MPLTSQHPSACCCRASCSSLESISQPCASQFDSGVGLMCAMNEGLVQVRNLKPCIKVAIDFVAPESVEQCLRLTRHRRELAKVSRTEAQPLVRPYAPFGCLPLTIVPWVNHGSSTHLHSLPCQSTIVSLLIEIHELSPVI